MNHPTNTPDPLDNLLDSFEQDLKLLSTYNTLERQQVSCTTAYKLAKDALLAWHKQQAYKELLNLIQQIENVNDSNGRYNACQELRKSAAERYGINND